MAFIREYMAQSGDPFSLRVPKKLRKLKVGRAIGKVAKSVLPIAAGFIPGLGGIASRLVSRVMEHPVIAQLAPMFPYVDEEQWSGFARAYGLDVGDPGSPTKSKRKAAASGTKAKAAKKAAVRETRAVRPHTKPATKGKPPLRLGGSGTKAIVDAIGAAKDIDFAGLANAAGKMFGAATGKGPTGIASMGGFGGHRRRINPGNVKALNRSLRRVEGFEKLVKRVMGHKLFKRVRGSVAHRSGHRHGCKCVACKRAA